MANNNERLEESQATILYNNRGYAYGDALFETIKVLNGKLLFWEDHYFRLMASMRILRMEIPMSFTMEHIEEEIIKEIKRVNLINSSTRVKLMINRVQGGLYSPEHNEINYIISCKAIDKSEYRNEFDTYEIDLFKDFYVPPGLLSTLKTNNKIINVVGSIYAKENNLQNCLLLNSNKTIVEALNGNLFLVKDNVVKTPPILDGCLKGIMRKQIISLITKHKDYNFVEESISPFELQKADELFITNVIKGIQSVTKYRKKVYKNTIAADLTEKLNLKIKERNSS